MFIARMTIPEKDNKFYIEKSCGGDNPGLKGPRNVKCQFRNCVFYALGRFAELWGIWMRSINAEYFVDVAKEMNLRVVSKPALGAILCFEGIGDLPGHVAVVEAINSNGTIVTSESGWSANKDFWTQTRTNSNGNWGQNPKSYKFQGFILPPSVDPVDINYTMPVLKQGMNKGEVRVLQQRLTQLGYFRDEVDGSFGIITLGAVLAFQFKNKLEVDGIVGPKTWKALGVNK